MEIAIAERPDGNGEDRALVFANGVTVLDGATTHHPGIPTASGYVGTFGPELTCRLDYGIDPRAAVRETIRATAAKLHLQPGASPSSTVAVVHVGPDTVTALLLGDSSVIVGTRDGNYEIRSDNRLHELSTPLSDQYRRRLAAGSGYDRTHHEFLHKLQQHQRVHRNRTGGYWIAEADPTAADHALRFDYPRDSVAWVIVATDGARDPMEALGIEWPTVYRQSSAGLRELLDRCHAWEADIDPHGRLLPRSKQHDDKTLAVIRLLSR